MHTKRVCRKLRYIDHIGPFTKPCKYAAQVALLYGAGSEASLFCMDCVRAFRKARAYAAKVSLLSTDGLRRSGEVAEAT